MIDTGNYYPRQRDGKIEGIENGLPESRWVEQQLGHPIIKVFRKRHEELFGVIRFPRLFLQAFALFRERGGSAPGARRISG